MSLVPVEYFAKKMLSYCENKGAFFKVYITQTSQGCKKRKRLNTFFASVCRRPKEVMTRQHQCYSLTLSGREATMVKCVVAIR